MTPAKTRPAPSASGGRTAGRGTRPRRAGSGPATVTAGPARAPEQLGLPGPGPRPRTLRPFTLPHFRAWASALVLDDGSGCTCPANPSEHAHFRLEPFQAAFVSDVFAVAPSGAPLYPECWFIVPEENGKSTITSALAGYTAEHRPFASIPVAAAAREQAEIIYRQLEGFVLRTGRLHELVHSDVQAAKGKRKLDVPRFTCLEGYRRVNHANGSRIQVFAADDRTGDGQIPTNAIIDEPHRQRDLSLYRTWSGKLNKRSGQIIAISTRGEPGTDFELTLERIKRSATRVSRRGSFTRYEAPGIVVHEWGLAEGSDPADMRAVKAANPFSRITVATLRAKRARPTMTLTHWLRFTCNRPQRGEDSAVTEAEWDAAGPHPGDPVAIPQGAPVWLGLDVAWKWDTTAATPLWWDSPLHRVLGDPEVLEPPRDGNSLDPREVEAALLRIHRRNPVHTVVMDTSRAEQLAVWIADTLGATVVDRPQTNAYAETDYDRFMEALRSGWLRHTGDPVLRTHVLNAVARSLPGGGTRFDRPTQSRGAPSEQARRVIDALSAASMANAWAAEPQPEPERQAPGLLGYYQRRAAEAAQRKVPA